MQVLSVRRKIIPAGRGFSESEWDIQPYEREVWKLYDGQVTVRMDRDIPAGFILGLLHCYIDNRSASSIEEFDEALVATGTGWTRHKITEAIKNANKA